MRSVQFARLFDELYREATALPGLHPVNQTAEDELLMILASLPQHWMDQRLRLSPTVFATDASPDGGGACSSTGLTARGHAKCRLLCMGDEPGGLGDPVILIGWHWTPATTSP